MAAASGDLWHLEPKRDGVAPPPDGSAVETGEAVLATYVHLVTGLLAARGQVLAVGPRLAKASGAAGWVAQESRVVSVHHRQVRPHECSGSTS